MSSTTPKKGRPTIGNSFRVGRVRAYRRGKVNSLADTIENSGVHNLAHWRRTLIAGHSDDDRRRLSRRVAKTRCQEANL